MRKNLRLEKETHQEDEDADSREPTKASGLNPPANTVPNQGLDLVLWEGLSFPVEENSGSTIPDYNEIRT